MTAHTEERRETPCERYGEALASLAKTQFRLADEESREAERWEADGNYRNFAACTLEARRLRRDARFHLNLARGFK